MLLSVKDVYNNYKEYLDKPIKIQGWVRTLRDSKAFGFIEVNDGTFFKNIQVIINDTLDNFEQVKKYKVGSGIEVEGILVSTEGAKQDFEIQATKISLAMDCTEDYPLQKKRHSFEFLRTMPHLRMRTNTFSAVFKVRSVLSYAFHKYFNERNYVYVHTPIITANDAEGAGELFNVSTFDYNNIPYDEDKKIDYKKDFFGRPVNLTCTGQLHVEAFALAYRNVYTFGPTFRAENSNTSRHAAEFWMIEPECAFMELPELLDMGEDMIKFLISYVMDNCKEELEFLNQFVEKGLLDKLNIALNSDYGRVTYTDAIEILKNAKQEFEYPVEWGNDLQSEHERYLTEVHFKKPVYITDYPKEIKAFYMRLNEDGKTVAASDLLVPGIGELIGGSQREEREEVLRAKMIQMDIPVDELEWYLELRKFGGVKHSGFGIGFARMLMYLTGMTNIRDVIPYPRTTKNAQF